jgi:hypothetical protein
MIVAYLKVLSWRLPGQTIEFDKIFQ